MGVAEKLPLHAAFGRAVREFRLARGLSQEALGHAADIDRSMVGFVERATRVPTLTTVDKLAHGLDVAPEDLVRRAHELQRALDPD